MWFGSAVALGRGISQHLLVLVLVLLGCELKQVAPQAVLGGTGMARCGSGSQCGAGHGAGGGSCPGGGGQQVGFPPMLSGLKSVPSASAVVWWHLVSQLCGMGEHGQRAGAESVGSEAPEQTAPSAASVPFKNET